MANTYNSFEQYISENAALRQTLADTLTEKGVEASGKEGYATLVEKVGAIETGVTLPTLSNPASPSEILNGYEAIGEDGSVIEGEALATASTATAADIMSGKTAYNSAGELLTGTAVKGLQLSVVSHTRTSSSSTSSASFTVSGTIKHVGVSCAVSSVFGSSRKFLDAFAVASGLQSYSAYTDYSGTEVNTDAKLTWTGRKLNVTTMNLGYDSVYTFYIFYE